MAPDFTGHAELWVNALDGTVSKFELVTRLAELLKAAYERGLHDGKRGEISFEEENDVH